MSNTHRKLELPSITKKKQEEWAEMESLYNSSYNSLTTAVATVGTIANMQNSLPETVDHAKLTNMVLSLNKNITRLRDELNGIYQHVQTTRDIDMDMMDVNMECIQIASQYKEWSNRFQTLCGQPLGDIIAYIEQ